VDGGFLIVLHGFEFGVIDDDLSPAFFRPSKDHQTLADGGHLLNVGHVEPTTRQRLDEDPAGFVFTRDLKHSPPAAKPPKRSLGRYTKKADRAFHLLIGEAVKSTSVFIPSRIVLDEIAEGRKSQTGEGSQPISRDPIQLAKR